MRHFVSRHQKIGRQFGTHQFVLLKHPNAINSLATIVEEGKTTTLWPLTAREFGNHFKVIMQELGVSSMKLTPASLRAGGATMFYNRGIAIGTLRFMGRWTVEKSLEHYLQLAMSTQIINRLDGVVISRLKKNCPYVPPACVLQWCIEYPPGKASGQKSNSHRNHQLVR